MSRVSERQRKAAQECAWLSPATLYPATCDTEAVTTKETRYKRVSLLDSQAREGSPPSGAAAPSRPGKRIGQEQLYSIDAQGRREIIKREVVGSAAYEQLLEAARANKQLPGDESHKPETPALPGWWEVPGEGQVPDADEMKAMIRRNLERAAERGKGIVKTWPR
jgi:hypothetical protein